MRVSVVLLVGCGRLAFEPQAGREDPCLTSPPVAGIVDFATITPLEADDPIAYDDDPTVTADGLELVFASDRAGSSAEDLWVSRRRDLAAPWEPPERIVELASAFSDGTPALACDGLTIWFSSNRPNPVTIGSDLWVSWRPDRTSRWGEPVHLAALASDNAEFSATVRADELEILFSSRPPGGGIASVMVSTRASRDADWDPPSLLDVSPFSEEGDPAMTPDGRIVYLGSDDGGDYDVFAIDRASRALFALSFNQAGSSEIDPHPSWDGRELYLSRDGVLVVAR